MRRAWAGLAIATAAALLVGYPTWLILESYRVKADANALSECTANMGRLGLGMLRYTLDHGDRLPEADAWVDQIFPYVKDWRVFRCPSDQSSGRSSYAYNMELSGKRLSDIAQPSGTVLLYEPIHAGTNPRGGAEDLPAEGRHRYPKWFTKIRLHVFLFADGDARLCERPFEPPLRWHPDSREPAASGE